MYTISPDLIVFNPNTFAMPSFTETTFPLNFLGPENFLIFIFLLKNHFFNAFFNFNLIFVFFDNEGNNFFFNCFLFKFFSFHQIMFLEFIYQRTVGWF